ncbi:MAG: DUF4410 domain-containing protein [Desulfatitalea sp.]|nr:DUF4410 domain-containing protein [Desulfatitalea sp.]
MTRKSARGAFGIFALLMVAMVVLVACGGQKAAPESAPAAEQEAPLPKAFRMIAVEEFQATPEVAKDHPDAMRECQARLIWTLEDKKAYQSVATAKPGQKHPAGTLLVKARITEMRIVHGAARFWGGVFAGSSYINMDLQLIDGATQAVLREKPLSSANNAWAASWVGGASDQSLPADMGRLVGEYIHSIIPR